MAALSPLTVPRWRAFLRDYSSRYWTSTALRNLERTGVAHLVPSEAQRASGWLGGAPASEEEIAAVEERSGGRLSPSYRDFLWATNGFTGIGRVALLPVEQVGWFPDALPGVGAGAPPPGPRAAPALPADRTDDGGG
ncbi:hypothetical protein SAMN02745673_02033 [Marinactinospora thermotolerans DSM 45154]|uniref:Knr4/Smi1-like domain-containing protein n=1 Tax=Marinactinospora thermotolerans DSM 45154 TaxID=1122192 RepID=A0A1T4PWC2_9ACTN|nr:SMI1/KNR4 family protein [Marinactinospora thermotolerans]SJZ95676.1 hypothetical protein SAMN02745673_02033 [Marinactinospora thermotolerans DSM 45154]